jgi:ferric-dicitrate binding protein FerR (iron transport regulator)
MNRASRAGLVLCLSLAACHRGEPAPGAALAGKAGSDDKQVLGRQLFELNHRAADYRRSHRGRYPVSVAQMGVDSLTPATARRLSSADGTLHVTVEFRRPAGHVLVSCSGGAEALEGAALNSGKYAASCMTAEGEVRPLQLEGGSR